MSKFAFIVVSFLALSVPNLSAQVNVATPSSIRVHHFVEKEGKTATKLLDELAKKYCLVIGVYGSGDFRFVEMPIGIDVEVKDGTLADVFDAIADSQRHSVSTHQTIGSVTDQQFDWHQDSNGAVHFELRGAPISLMDVTVPLFDYENPQWPEVTARLRAIPEIDRWLKEHECPMPGEDIFLAGKPPAPWRHFSIHARDLPFYEILDQIAAETGTYYWRAAQITGSPCHVSIQWWL
jgi:hypothetical protein